MSEKQEALSIWKGDVCRVPENGEASTTESEAGNAAGERSGSVRENQAVQSEFIRVLERPNMYSAFKFGLKSDIWMG